MKPLLIFFRADNLEVWSIDSNNRLSPLNYNGTNIHPLYFLIHNDEITIGKYAKEQFERKIHNAYGNYWDSSFNNELTVNRFNKSYAVSDILFYFLKETLLKEIVKAEYKEVSNFDYFINNYSISLLFDSYLNEDIRNSVVKGLIEIVGFKSNNINSLDFWQLFHEYHLAYRNLNEDESYIEVTSAFGDLFIHLVSRASPFLQNRKIIKGRGNDPRLDTVLEFIAEKAIGKGSLMSKDEIKKEAFNDGLVILGKLNNGLVEHRIKLPDISQFTLSFHANAITTRLNNKSSLNFIQNEFDSFRNQNHAGDYKIFLNGDILNSRTFNEFFKYTYSNVFDQEKKFEEELIIRALTSASKLSSLSSHLHVTEDGESIDQLLFKIQCAMKSRDELVRELTELENAKKALERKKKELIGEIDKLNSEITAIEGKKQLPKPPKADVPVLKKSLPPPPPPPIPRKK